MLLFESGGSFHVEEALKDGLPALAENLQEADGGQVLVDAQTPLVERPKFARSNAFLGVLPLIQMLDHNGQGVRQFLLHDVVCEKAMCLFTKKDRVIGTAAQLC